MNDKVSDNDRDLVSKAMVSNNRFALNSFLYGESEIIIISDVMLRGILKYLFTLKIIANYVFAFIIKHHTSHLRKY